MIFFCVVYGEICISLRLSILCIIIIIIINIEARIEECAAALERFIQLLAGSFTGSIAKWFCQ